MNTIRYSRLESLPGIGEEGVRLMNSGRVLVIGCGALGSLCSMYLAASGIGTLSIADFDTIDLSNLQRQLFYKESELGLSKCETLGKRLAELNSSINIELIPGLVNLKKAQELFLEFDFIIDGSDNPSTKYLTASVCESLGVPYCIGGVREFGGQVMTWIPGHTGYRELFGETPPCSGVTPCSIGGVLGPAAGIVASMQAAEAIKFLTHAGELLTDRLFNFDLSTPSATVLSFS